VPWRIPGFALGEEIGRGGSAIVYQAAQYDPPRTVAVKILLPIWTDGTGVRERFRLEAQALAQLDHPGILPVLASGEINGVPWYSMPLASGGNLAQRRSAAQGNFKLIAAEAVAHAHTRGVLHRDVKPANIVFSDDGRLFVSDFGLARVVATSSEVTMTAAVLGTPAYMAPEVIAHGIRAATVAADVWGLGAILHELLAGHRPFEAESIPELVRLIVSEEPKPAAGAPTELAAIANKALQKNPDRRYLTAQAMADDLRAWLSGKPVTARPYSRWEQLGFSIKKHPIVTSGIVVLLLAMTAAVLVSVQETRLRKMAEAAHAAADLEAATSREILRFLQTDLLSQASPESQPDRAITLRTVLDRAAKSVDGRFPNQPLVEAAIHETLASTYTALGDEPTGHAQAQKALALFLREKGPDSPEVLRMRHYEIFDYVIKGRFVDAETLANQTLEAARRILPSSSPDLYVAWGDLARVYWEWSKYERAEQIIHADYEACRKALGPDDPESVTLEWMAATALSATARRAESLPLFERSLEDARRVFGKENGRTFDAMNSYSNALGEQGRFAEAVVIGRELLELRRRVCGPENVATVITMINLALSLIEIDKLQEANELLEQARPLFHRRYGSEDLRNLTCDRALVTNLVKLGRYREGVAIAAKDLPLAEQRLGRNHIVSVLLRFRLAQCYRGNNQLTEALELGTQCVEQFSQLRGPGSHEILIVKLLLADIHRDAGRIAEASRLYQEVLTSGSNPATKAMQEAWAAEGGLSQVMILQGQFGEAEAAARQLAYQWEKELGPAEDRCLAMKLELACLLTHRGAWPEAEKLLRQIIVHREQDAGKNARATLNSWDALGVTLALQGKWAEAEALLRQSHEHGKAIDPGCGKDGLNQLYLGWVMLSSGHPVEAKTYLETAYPIVTDPTRRGPIDRLLYQGVTAQLAKTFHETGDSEASARWQKQSTW